MCTASCVLEHGCLLGGCILLCEDLLWAHILLVAICVQHGKVAGGNGQCII